MNECPPVTAFLPSHQPCPTRHELPACSDKVLHLHFLRAPEEVVAGEGGGAAQLRLERTRLEAASNPGGNQRAVGTGGCGCRGGSGRGCGCRPELDFESATIHLP